MKKFKLLLVNGLNKTENSPKYNEKISSRKLLLKTELHHLLEERRPRPFPSTSNTSLASRISAKTSS